LLPSSLPTSLVAVSILGPADIRNKTMRTRVWMVWGYSREGAMFYKNFKTEGAARRCYKSLCALNPLAKHEDFTQNSNS
ncbi:MAG: hypothetical protein QXI19_07725, partial [Candidatus Caldarchaeum sp.]